MKHQLKTVNPHFTDIKDGYKTFEIRKNDRDFKTGDILILSEWHGPKCGYSGEQIEVSVEYILKDFIGLKKGYVVLGIKDYVQ